MRPAQAGPDVSVFEPSNAGQNPSRSSHGFDVGCHWLRPGQSRNDGFFCFRRFVQSGAGRGRRWCRSASNGSPLSRSMSTRAAWWAKALAQSLFPLLSSHPTADAEHTVVCGFVGQDISARDGLDHSLRKFEPVGFESLAEIIPAAGTSDPRG